MFPLFSTGVHDRCHWYRWQFATSVVDTGGKFATGVNNTSGTGGKIATGVVDISGAPWLANIFANFWKKFEMTLMLFSGAWGWFMKKTWSKKSCDTVPLMFSNNIFSQLTNIRPVEGTGVVIPKLIRDHAHAVLASATIWISMRPVCVV